MNYLKKKAASVLYRLSQSKEVIDEDIRFAGFSSVEDAVIESRPFANILRYRLRKESKVLAKLSTIFIKTMNDLELNITSGKVGKGFRIWHGYGTVVFCESIGDYCSLNQGVTLGRGRPNTEGRDIPVIGDHVTIYTNAVVIGGITIGNNVEIGAGAVVIHDVPDNSVVAGVPAKVIRTK